MILGLPLPAHLSLLYLHHLPASRSTMKEPRSCVALLLVLSLHCLLEPANSANASLAGSLLDARYASTCLSVYATTAPNGTDSVTLLSNGITSHSTAKEPRSCVALLLTLWVCRTPQPARVATASLANGHLDAISTPAQRNASDYGPRRITSKVHVFLPSENYLHICAPLLPCPHWSCRPADSGTLCLVASSRTSLLRGEHCTMYYINKVR